MTMNSRIDLIGQNGNDGLHYYTTIDGLDIFVDVEYYHMWGVCPTGERGMDKTVHFSTYNECIGYIQKLSKENDNERTE